VAHDKRLRLSRRPDKARTENFRSPPMLGIAVIVIFIAVIAILNRVEFGRFD
jgi:ribose/xylose/arabinose/galactoside ABC-type transport system permease subunit